MSYDVSSKRGEWPSTVDAIARKCRLDEEDEARALSVYQGMIDAIADRVTHGAHKPSPPPAAVYIAAYQHRYGVDLSAHASRDHAESRLLSIAWNQCMRDPEIRAAVDARFGPLVSEEPPLEPPFEADLEMDREMDRETDRETDRATDRETVQGADGERRCARTCGDSELQATALAPIEELASGAAASGRQARDRREERRRTFCEQLLEEWPSFAKGESLWIAECVVEDDEDPDGWHDEASRHAAEADEADQADQADQVDQADKADEVDEADEAER